MISDVYPLYIQTRWFDGGNVLRTFRLVKCSGINDFRNSIRRLQPGSKLAYFKRRRIMHRREITVKPEYPMFQYRQAIFRGDAVP